MPGKVSIIGAGNVGASCAQRITERGHADIVLLDIVDGLAQGKALDIRQSAPIIGFGSRIIGSSRYEETAGSDVIVITAGISRKPGMTRDELIQTNMDIVAGVVREVAKHSPEGIIIMVTNPVDALTYLALKTSGFPRGRVLGLSGVLDGARLGSFIAGELGVSPADVFSCVLGEHGQNMVVIPRLCAAGGTPITRLLSPEAIARLIERTIGGGAEIVGLLKTGSAFYAPSAAVARMVDAVIRDGKEVLSCAACLDGEYGIRDAVIGVPVRLGRSGIEEIIELELTPEEKQALAASADAVRQLISTIKSV